MERGAAVPYSPGKDSRVPPALMMRARGDPELGTGISAFGGKSP